MSLLMSLIKKFLLGLTVIIYLILLFVSLTNAQEAPTAAGPGSAALTGISTCTDSDSCLKAITQNTYATLQSLNTVIAQYLLNLTTPESGNDASPMTTMQGNFTSLGNSIIQYLNPQNLIDPVQLILDIINRQPTENAITFTKADVTGEKPKILNLLPEINDISYATVMGQPVIPNAPANPYNYLKYISGMNIIHLLPRDEWGGSLSDKEKYRAYYHTVLAAESFNGYILNSQHTSSKNLTEIQTQLLTQATSGEQWFAQIATEEIGKILRQLLMFESQNYVLMTQLVQIQKQLLTAQSLNNALLILNNQQNECMMVARARGIRPVC